MRITLHLLSHLVQRFMLFQFLILVRLKVLVIIPLPPFILVLMSGLLLKMHARWHLMQHISGRFEHILSWCLVLC